MSEIIWRSDCCQCILIVESRAQSPTVAYIDWIQKCDIHKGFSDQPLVNAVTNHNRTFQLSIPNPTAQEKQANRIAKADERARILALGAPVKK